MQLKQYSGKFEAQIGVVHKTLENSNAIKHLKVKAPINKINIK